MSISGLLQIIKKHPSSAIVKGCFSLHFSPFTHYLFFNAVIHGFLEPWRSLQTLIFFALSVLALCFTEQDDRTDLQGGRLYYIALSTRSVILN